MGPPFQAHGSLWRAKRVKLHRSSSLASTKQRWALFRLNNGLPPCWGSRVDRSSFGSTCCLTCLQTKFYRIKKTCLENHHPRNLVESYSSNVLKARLEPWPLPSHKSIKLIRMLSPEIVATMPPELWTQLSSSVLERLLELRSLLWELPLNVLRDIARGGLGGLQYSEQKWGLSTALLSSSAEKMFSKYIQARCTVYHSSITSEAFTRYPFKKTERAVVYWCLGVLRLAFSIFP